MNDNLKKIAAEAKLGGADFGNGVKYFVGTEETFAKFALLIVQECATVVSKVPPGYRDYRDQIEEAMRDDCVAAMLKHFGVES